jgi:hypothetical protein
MNGPISIMINTMRLLPLLLAIAAHAQDRAPAQRLPIGRTTSSDPALGANHACHRN